MDGNYLVVTVMGKMSFFSLSPKNRLLRKCSSIIGISIATVVNAKVQTVPKLM